ncbi:hypothetical protein Ancab_011995 [Ancistrocladus abbreviatus]
MVVDQRLGYPRVYAKLCRDRGQSPYSHGPPFTFTPYSLQPLQGLRAKELDAMFPIIDPGAKPNQQGQTLCQSLVEAIQHLGGRTYCPWKSENTPTACLQEEPHQTGNFSSMVGSANGAFCLLFSGGENEELNDSQTVDSHNFPQPLMESKEDLGLAPVTIVATQNESSAARKSNGVLNENENPRHGGQSISSHSHGQRFLEAERRNCQDEGRDSKFR